MESLRSEALRLEALRRYGILDTEPETVFDQLTRIGTALLQTPICAIGLLDEHRVWCKSVVGVNVQSSAREHSFCTHAIRRVEQPFVVTDAILDPRFASNPFVKGPPNVRFYAGAPLISVEGAAIGTFCVVDYSPRPGGLTSEQKALLQDLANVAMNLIESRLERSILRQTERRLHLIQSEMSDKVAAQAKLIVELEEHVALHVSAPAGA